MSTVRFQCSAGLGRPSYLLKHCASGLLHAPGGVAYGFRSWTLPRVSLRRRSVFCAGTAAAGPALAAACATACRVAVCGPWHCSGRRRGPARQISMGLQPPDRILSEAAKKPRSRPNSTSLLSARRSSIFSLPAKIPSGSSCFGQEYSWNNSPTVGILSG